MKYMTNNVNTLNALRNIEIDLRFAIGGYCISLFAQSWIFMGALKLIGTWRVCYQRGLPRLVYSCVLQVSVLEKNLFIGPTSWSGAGAGAGAGNCFMLKYY